MHPRSAPMVSTVRAMGIVRAMEMLWVLAMAGTLWGTEPAAARVLPNIVMILADDMGYGDLKCYDPAARTETAQIDQLAREGMRFTDAHAAAAWCTPSRYGLLTGRYPWRSPRPLDQGVIEPQRLTLASLLKRQGYVTGCIGKWHLGFVGSAVERDFSQPFLGGPRAHGFDYFFGMHASLDIPPYYWLENERCLAPPTEAVAASHSADVTEIQGAFWRAGLQSPGFVHADVLPTLASRAVEFLREHASTANGRPVFLYLPLTAPHTPWLPRGEFQGRSGAGDYGDFVGQVDSVVGQVLATLAELKLAANTLVIFSSDNGPVWYPQDIQRFAHRSAGPLRGMKMDLWEGGHRVPFIVRWPGVVPAATSSDQLICLTDVMATVAAVVGMELPEDAGEDSVNLLPVLRGEPRSMPVRETLVIERRMIRQGQWKLVQGNPTGGLARLAHPAVPLSKEPIALFDLQADLSETTSLAEQRPDKVAELQALLEQSLRTSRGTAIDSPVAK